MESISFKPTEGLIKPLENRTMNNSATVFDTQKSFSSVLKQEINKINDTQIKADRLTEQLATGGNVDLHQVMIASQKASITMQAALEIRNKAVEAYQEMMRMQV
ncbi:flagellar hook-basal body complex protein FliE [Bacillus massilinigeriensis]|uniref:flagellar hook-basal body complex protein FliE n=1 Tax=Bacillus mediterraneensis TaxID=1805474 RepID=UPI0008F89960|nr:flagellar hook-basal body complex protein FliE [Bacillus mediterraneensis]